MNRFIESAHWLNGMFDCYQIFRPLNFPASQSVRLSVWSHWQKIMNDNLNHTKHRIHNSQKSIEKNLRLNSKILFKFQIQHNERDKPPKTSLLHWSIWQAAAIQSWEMPSGWMISIEFEWEKGDKRTSQRRQHSEWVSCDMWDMQLNTTRQLRKKSKMHSKWDANHQFWWSLKFTLWSRHFGNFLAVIPVYGKSAKLRHYIKATFLYVCWVWL